EQLVQHVCFNLEMWSEPLFAKVCPGKNRYVGYHRWIEALETAMRYCSRGIIPIYSLVWPVGGRDRTDYHTRIRSYFETLSAGYQEIRKRHGLVVSEGFMCHRCAYMQLECDLDRTVLEAA